jgi:hypothetical protein
MIDKKVLLVWLLLASLSASSIVEAKNKSDKKKANLRTSECATESGKGKKCKLKRTNDEDVFAANEISIQLDVDGEIQEFVGGSFQGGNNQQPQWYGSDGRFAMNLIEFEGSTYGSYSDNEFTYSISTDDEGNSIVTGKATADFPDELESDGESPSEGETNNGSVRNLGLRARSSSSSFLNTTQRQLIADEDTILDVMVVWTRNAECKNSGKSKGCQTTEATKTAMLGLIDLAVAETNVAFKESIVHATIRLVHAYQDPTYTEGSMSRALKDITYTGGKYAALDDVHTIRADVGADLVAMIINDSASCGVAWKGPGKGSMFSVTHHKCTTGYFSFGHEIGHNLVSSKR